MKVSNLKDIKNWKNTFRNKLKLFHFQEKAITQHYESGFQTLQNSIWESLEIIAAFSVVACSIWRMKT